MLIDPNHAKEILFNRIRIEGKMSGQILNQAITAAPMARTLKDDYPEVKEIVRIARFGAWLVRHEDKKYNEDGILFADSTFFKVFDFELIQGSPVRALALPSSLVLTKSFAKKYLELQFHRWLVCSLKKW